MRLLRQEIYKILVRPIVLFVLVLLVCLNFCQLTLSGVTSEIKQINTKRAFNLVRSLPENERIYFVKKHLQQLYQFTDTPNLLVGDNLGEELQIFLGIEKQLQHIDNYSEYINSIYDDSKAKVSIFQRDSGYANKDKIATRKAFKPFKNVHPEFVNSDFLLTATENPAVDFLNLLFIGFVVVSLFSYEKRQGLLQLFATMQLGRSQLARAKIISIGIVVLISTSLFWGGAFLISNLIYGAELSAPLQSVLGYDRSALNVSIGEYLLIFFLTKLCITLLVALVIFYFTQITRRTTSTYGLIGVTFLLAFFMRLFIAGDSSWGLLYFLNIIPFLAVYPIYKFYFNLNICGTPINITTLFWLLTLSLIVLLITITLILFERAIFQPSKSIFNFKFHIHTGIHTNLFVHELYKLFIVHKGIVVLIVLCVAQILLAFNISSPDIDEYYYQNYMFKLSGQWDSFKQDYIDQEIQHFAELKSLLGENQKKYNAKQISEREYNAAQGYLVNKLKPENALNRVCEKIEVIKSLPASKQILVYNSGYKKIMGFNNVGNSPDIIQTILFLLSAIIVLVPFICEEYESTMIRIIKTTTKGNYSLLSIKLISGLLIVIFFFIASHVPILYVVNKYYPLTNWQATVQTIVNTKNQYLANLPIYAYLVIFFVIRFSASYFTLLICYLAASKIKKSHVTISLLLISLIFPLILKQLGFKIIDYLSLNIIFTGSILLQSSTIISVVAILFIWTLVLSLIFYLLKRSWK